MSAPDRHVNARRHRGRAIQVELLVVEEDVRPEGSEYARLVHAAQKERLVNGDAPVVERGHDALVRGGRFGS